jgi:SAM-dependent methyltransferase
MSKPAYDELGRGYAKVRRADPRIAARIDAALGDARTVINVGAGAGSYEPPDREVTAVEPSATMIAQRPPGAATAIQAGAEQLPFGNDSFDAAMAVQTVHHWADRDAGLNELQRVTRQRIVLVAFDPEALADLWITRDYFPEILDLKRRNASTGRGLAGAAAKRVQPAASGAARLPGPFLRGALGTAGDAPRRRGGAADVGLAEHLGRGKAERQGAARRRPRERGLG